MKGDGSRIQSCDPNFMIQWDSKIERGWIQDVTRWSSTVQKKDNSSISWFKGDASKVQSVTQMISHDSGGYSKNWDSTKRINSRFCALFSRKSALVSVWIFPKFLWFFWWNHIPAQIPSHHRISRAQSGQVRQSSKVFWGRGEALPGAVRFEKDGFTRFQA